MWPNSILQFTYSLHTCWGGCCSGLVNNDPAQLGYLCPAPTMVSLEACACAQVVDVLLVVLMFPGGVLCLAAGALFGLTRGCVLVWIGTVIGQTIAFVLGRCGNLDE